MNIAKNMEALFIAAIAAAAFATFATADAPAPAKPVAQFAADTKIATVVVSAKRLSAAEKSRLGS
jgi:hypothetical protein